jgi:hypothetical protein
MQMCVRLRFQSVLLLIVVIAKYVFSVLCLCLCQMMALWKIRNM